MMATSSKFRDLGQRIKDYTSGTWDVKVTSDLVRKLYAIDKTLASTLIDQQKKVEFDQADEEISLSRFERWAGHSKGDELSRLLDEEMPIKSKYRLIWAYEKAYKAALEGRHYVNYDTRGSGKACSDVLHILPKIDDLLGTRLYKRYNQLASKSKQLYFPPNFLLLSLYRAGLKLAFLTSQTIPHPRAPEPTPHENLPTHPCLARHDRLSR